MKIKTRMTKLISSNNSSKARMIFVNFANFARFGNVALSLSSSPGNLGCVKTGLSPRSNYLNLECCVLTSCISDSVVTHTLFLILPARQKGPDCVPVIWKGSGEPFQCGVSPVSHVQTTKGVFFEPCCCVCANFQQLRQKSKPLLSLATFIAVGKLSPSKQWRTRHARLVWQSNIMASMFY